MVVPIAPDAPRDWGRDCGRECGRGDCGRECARACGCAFRGLAGLDFPPYLYTFAVAPDTV